VSGDLNLVIQSYLATLQFRTITRPMFFLALGDLETELFLNNGHSMMVTYCKCLHSCIVTTAHDTLTHNLHDFYQQSNC